MGKTSILKSYCTDTEINIRQTGYFETIIKRNGRTIPLTIYDTGGQERFRSMTNSYYRGAKGCILCFDVTKSESFYSLERWLKDVTDYVGNDIACVLVATRCGTTANKREVSTEDALAFAHKKEIPLIELSSLDKQNIDRIFKLLADMMVNGNQCSDVKPDVTECIKLRCEQRNNSGCCS